MERTEARERRAAEEPSGPEAWIWYGCPDCAVFLRARAWMRSRYSKGARVCPMCHVAIPEEKLRVLAPAGLR